MSPSNHFRDTCPEESFLLQNAWDEGFSARRCGSKDSDNPYPLSGMRLHQTLGDKLHFEWAKGYTCGAFEGCKAVIIEDKS